MIRISLHKLVFNSFHGVYDEEKKIGNDFEVNLDVYFHESVPMITQLDETINYAALFELVKERMALPEPLLETLAMDIATQAKQQFPVIVEINVSISKINMPLTNFRGNISVSYNKKYDGTGLSPH